MCMRQPSEPGLFGFDAEEIFNNSAESDDDAWARFQEDGTVNINEFFGYILEPEVFEKISKEFDIYKYYLREKQCGFEHFHIDVERFCQSQQGINQTPILDDEDEKNCTLLAIGFWKVTKV
ncbi:MAG: hypothetical protein M1840_001995 [Geoglossum simile]|nr:MAG: hypothetical protein M1840_001995 [Geoglossum simile]